MRLWRTVILTLISQQTTDYFATYQGSSSYLVSALDMDLNDQIPILILHVLKADVPKNTSIIDEHVNPPKLLDSSLDDLLAILDAVVVRDRLAASGCDFVDDNIGGLSLSGCGANGGE